MLKYFSQTEGEKVFDSNKVSGKIFDFYFDDSSWEIKDIILRKNILKNEFKQFDIKKINVENVGNKKCFVINKIFSETILSKEEKKPILHSDYVLSKIFGWPNLWSIADSDYNNEGLLYSSNYTNNLRSIREVKGYLTKLKDNYTGYIEDFLINVDKWTIDYLTVNENNYLPIRKKAVLNTSEIELEVKYPTAIINHY